ncbi:MAG: DUF2946 family protein [Thermodesulfobacteriota bacterium]
MKLPGKSRTRQRLVVALLCLSFFSFTLYASSCFASQNHLPESEPSHAHYSHEAMDSNTSHQHDGGHRHDEASHTCICKYADLLNSTIIRSAPHTVTPALVSLPLPPLTEVPSITPALHTLRHTRAPPRS